MKTSGIISLLTLGAVVISCSKDAVGVKGTAIEFTASVEDASTKAGFNGTKVYFEQGDKIRVCDSLRTTKKECRYQAASGTFTGTGLAASNVYYAVYRYQASAAPGSTYSSQVANLDAGGTYDGVKDEVTLYSTIYDHQRAVLNGYDQNSAPMYGKALSSDLKIKFIHGTALLKFDLQYENVDTVILTSLSEVTLTGNCGYSLLDSDGDGWFDVFHLKNWDTGNSPTITLLPPTDGSPFPKGVYYIAARPGKKHNGGLSLTFKHGDTVLMTASNTKAVTLNRGMIRNLGTFAEENEPQGPVKPFIEDSDYILE